MIYLSVSKRMAFSGCSESRTSVKLICSSSRRISALAGSVSEEYTSSDGPRQNAHQLRAERDGIDQAILVLQRIAAGRGRRRGRPPAWMSNVKRRGRPPGSKNKANEEE